ncbi:hypothetical protein [Haloarchaeobius sp. DFWS5]|uniref:hypothetical protein n=1 Tax=Haloarchaeobius sp. DFWS5 TaxID=3446114 RepID=UPI003EBC99AA
MDRSPLLHLLVVCCLLLSGCSSVTDPGTQQPTSAVVTDDIGTTERTQQPPTTTGTTTVTQTTGTSYAGAAQGGRLRAAVVDDPPANATVTEFDQANLSHPVVTGAIESAVEDGTFSTSLSASELANVEDDLSAVPAYDGDVFGQYVRYEGTVIRLRLIQNG